MKSSLEIWPSCKKISEELIVPVNISLSPHSLASSQNAISLNIKNRCPKCHACYTKNFPVKDNKCTCIFCNTTIEVAETESFEYEEYSIQESTNSLNFYICFVADLRCPNEFIQIMVLYIKIALQALPSGTNFALMLLHDNFVSFIKVLHGKCYSFDFSFDSHFFELTKMESVLNSSYDIDPIINYLPSLKNIMKSEANTNFERIFKPMPSDSFIHFVVFTSFYQNFTTAENISFDLFSLIPMKGEPSINGLAFSQTSVEDVSLQIQNLVQRLQYFYFILNLNIQVFSPLNIDVSPQTITRSSIRRGMTINLNVNFSKCAIPVSEIPIEIVCTYNNPISWNRSIKTTYVISKIFKTSSNFYSLLSSIDPALAIQNGVTQEFVSNLYNIYSNKILNNLPGDANQDLFFNLLPNLRWIVRAFLVSRKNRFKSYIADDYGMLSSKIPQISFWSDQNTLIADKIECVPFVESIVGKPHLIVVDFDYKIEVFADEMINPQSEIDKFIQYRIIHRFPVPRVTNRELDQFKTVIPPYEEWIETLQQFIK